MLSSPLINLLLLDKNIFEIRTGFIDIEYDDTKQVMRKGNRYLYDFKNFSP